jgi:eukaryotic-like serine/threonine-protein kinase
VTFGQDYPSNLFWREDDARSPVARLTTSTNAQAPNAWSADGAHLAITQTDSQMGNHIWILSLKDGQTTLNPWRKTTFQQRRADFSPDGRWLAYTSNESGRNEVYVAPYPGPGPRYPVSTKGGECPAWSRDGHKIFYSYAVDNSPVRITMMAATVSYKSGEFTAAPRKLFEGEFWLSSPGRGYDVSADGRRFVMVQPRPLATHPVTQILIVGNWTEELRRLLSRP